MESPVQLGLMDGGAKSCSALLRTYLANFIRSGNAHKKIYIESRLGHFNFSQSLPDSVQKASFDDLVLFHTSCDWTPFRALAAPFKANRTKFDASLSAARFHALHQLCDTFLANRTTNVDCDIIVGDNFDKVKLSFDLLSGGVSQVISASKKNFDLLRHGHKFRLSTEA